MQGSFIYSYTWCFPGIKLLGSPRFKLSEGIVIIELYQISCCFAIKIKCNDQVKYILNINRKGMKWSFISISTRWFVVSTLERPLPCCFLKWMRINIFDCHLVFFLWSWTIRALSWAVLFLELSLELSSFLRSLLSGPPSLDSLELTQFHCSFEYYPGRTDTQTHAQDPIS